MLEVAGNLEIDVDGSHGRLSANGQQLLLELDQPTALAGIFDRQTVRDLAAGLAQAGLTLHLRSGDRLLLRAGHDAKPGLLSRLLRLPNVQLNPRYALHTALGRGHPRP